MKDFFEKEGLGGNGPDVAMKEVINPQLVWESRSRELLKMPPGGAGGSPTGLVIQRQWETSASSVEGGSPSRTSASDDMERQWIHERIHVALMFLSLLTVFLKTWSRLGNASPAFRIFSPRTWYDP